MRSIMLVLIIWLALLAFASASHAFYFSSFGGSGYRSGFSGYSYSNYGYSSGFSPSYRAGYYSNPFGSYYGGYSGRGGASFLFRSW